MPKARKTLARLASGSDALLWRKLEGLDAARRYGVDVVWTVRITRKYRLFVHRGHGVCTILGCLPRSNKVCYSSER